MDHYTIERIGIPNLDFDGEIIGTSGGASPRIKIYRTKGLKYVAQLDANLKFSKAQHFDKPAEAIAWFRNTPVGIDAEIENAIEDAAQHDDGFRAVWNEHVN